MFKTVSTKLTKTLEICQKTKKKFFKECLNKQTKEKRNFSSLFGCKYIKNLGYAYFHIININ